MYLQRTADLRIRSGEILWRAVEVQLHSFLTLAPDGGCRSTSLPSSFYPIKISTVSSE